MKRPTPLFDSWRQTAAVKLAPHGRKAELSRYMAQRYGRPARSWESNIGQILSGALVPNAEIFLAIDDWVGKTDG